MHRRERKFDMRFKELLQGQIYDLGHMMEKSMPVFPSHPPFFMTLNNRHGDIEGMFGCGFGSANEVIVTSGHHSTHIDALSHVSFEGDLYGGVRAADVQKGEGLQRGFVQRGVEEIGPIVRRGLLLDIAAWKGVDALAPGEAVSADDLEACAAAQQVSIGAGDCVLLRTGWATYWENTELFLGHQGGMPGPDLGAARWLADCGILLAGSDTIAFEVRRAGSSMDVHMELIARRGIPIVESLNLEELSRDGIHEFLFIALPLKIQGATGSPIRPVAIV